MIDPTWWERLAAMAPADVAERAAVEWLDGENAFRVRLAGAWYAVEPETRRVANLDTPDAKVGYGEHLALVLYLVGARAVEPAGRWVKPETLPSGEFFFRGPHAMPTAKLAEAFGHEPARLLAAAETLDGRPIDMGDTAVAIPALARVPLALAVWAADEEFGPEASLLVDPTASEHLMHDALWMLGIHVINRLCAAAQ